MKTEKLELVSGLTMACHCYGSGGDTFVLLHGIPGSSFSWAQVAAKLSESGASVVVPDLLGFGQSSRPADIDTLWLDSQAQAVVQCLEKLGVQQFHLVGHDYGGPISVTLYGFVRNKIKSLTLLATNTFADTPIPLPLAMIKAPVIGSLWEKAIFSRASLGMMLKQGVGDKNCKINAEASLGDRQQVRAIATIFGTALRELQARYQAVENSLPKISVVSKVIWGTHDQFFSLEQGKRTAEAISGAKFVVLQGAGHFLPEERAEDVARELMGFLQPGH